MKDSSFKKTRWGVLNEDCVVPGKQAAVRLPGGVQKFDGGHEIQAEKFLKKVTVKTWGIINKIAVICGSYSFVIDYGIQLKLVNLPSHDTA